MVCNNFKFMLNYWNSKKHTSHALIMKKIRNSWAVDHWNKTAKKVENDLIFCVNIDEEVEQRPEMHCLQRER